MICKLFLLSLTVVFGLLNASPVPQDSTIISQHDVRNADGYDWGYELSNGQKHSEIAKYEGDSAVVTGSYSFVGTDGLTHTVTYTADENGYKPIISTSSGGDRNIEMIPHTPTTRIAEIPEAAPISSELKLSLIGG